MLHGRLGRLQIGLGHDGTDLFLEFLDVRLQPPHFRHAVEHEADLCRCERLGQVVDRPAAHGFNGRFDRGVSGDGDDRQAGSQSQQARQDVEPILLSQPEIEEDDVKQHVADILLSLRGLAGFGEAVADRLQRQPQRLPQAHFVVNQQDIHGLAPNACLADTFVTR